MDKTHPITEYRRRHHLSLDALGRRVGVTRTTVSRWEKGDRKIKADLVEKVADETGISVQELRPDLGRLFRHKEPAE